MPRGVLASRPEDIVDPPLPAAVKAQVLIGGRGKAGGIKFAKTAEEAREAARQVLGMAIGPYTSARCTRRRCWTSRRNCT